MFVTLIPESNSKSLRFGDGCSFRTRSRWPHPAAPLVYRHFQAGAPGTQRNDQGTSLVWECTRGAQLPITHVTVVGCCAAHAGVVSACRARVEEDPSRDARGAQLAGATRQGNSQTALCVSALGEGARQSSRARLACAKPPQPLAHVRAQREPASPAHLGASKAHSRDAPRRTHARRRERRTGAHTSRPVHERAERRGEPFRRQLRSTCAELRGALPKAQDSTRASGGSRRVPLRSRSVLPWRRRPGPHGKAAAALRRLPSGLCAPWQQPCSPQLLATQSS